MLVFVVVQITVDRSAFVAGFLPFLGGDKPLRLPVEALRAGRPKRLVDHGGDADQGQHQAGCLKPLLFVDRLAAALALLLLQVRPQCTCGLPVRSVQIHVAQGFAIGDTRLRDIDPGAALSLHLFGDLVQRS